MDPVTHTLAGAALARAGLQRRTPLAAATLMLAANAPDIDILSAVGGEYSSLAFRRGWTHGPLGMLALPFVVAGCVLIWDRFVRRRQDSTRAPAGPGAVVLLALIGTVSHPLLDWLNTYGIRLLMPFNPRWFYGDAVFIIDPWIWLLLGGGLYLAGPHSRARTLRWLVLAALTSLAVLLAPPVPVAARALWCTGLLAIASLRVRVGDAREHAVVRCAGVCAVVYVLCLIGASAVGVRVARSAARAAGITGVVEVLYAPLPANPWAAQIVVATDADYRYGELRWLRNVRIRMLERTLSRGDWSEPAVVRALSLPAVRDYLVWARFPYVRTEPSDGSTAVTIGDARYADGTRTGGLAGLRVVVPDDVQSEATRLQTSAEGPQLNHRPRRFRCASWSCFTSRRRSESARALCVSARSRQRVQLARRLSAREVQPGTESLYSSKTRI
jgi:inner membrane protein